MRHHRCDVVSQISRKKSYDFICRRNQVNTDWSYEPYIMQKMLFFIMDSIGLTSQDQKLLVPTQCVLRLTQPFEGSNLNVTADNWFSSIQLIDELSKRELTYVGTMKKKEPSQFQPQKMEMSS